MTVEAPRFDSLDQLANFLRHLKAPRTTIAKNHYDYSVSVCLYVLLECRSGRVRRIPQDIFRVYLDGEVADNKQSIVEQGHIDHYKRLKDRLKILGYASFHEDFFDYYKFKLNTSSFKLRIQA